MNDFLVSSNIIYFMLRNIIVKNICLNVKKTLHLVSVINFNIMKSRYLFSHKFKPVGWFIFLVGVTLGVILMFNDFDYPNWELKVYPLIGEEKGFLTFNPKFEWSTNNIADELAAVLIIIGGILVCFSKTKDEDEYISKIRMESLIWATYINYAVLILAIFFVFEMSFFNVMIYNMFTLLLFFILRFHFVLYKSKKSFSNEE